MMICDSSDQMHYIYRKKRNTTMNLCVHFEIEVSCSHLKHMQYTESESAIVGSVLGGIEWQSTSLSPKIGLQGYQLVFCIPKLLDSTLKISGGPFQSWNATVMCH